MKSLVNIWQSVRSFYEARQEPKIVLSLVEWYWTALLILACISLALAVFFGAWSFSNVMHSLTAGERLRPAENPTPITKQKLREALSAYDLRATRFEEAKNSTATIPDPSR